MKYTCMYQAMIGAMRPTIPSETQLVAAGGKRGWWVGKLFDEGIKAEAGLLER
jgi:hypothetical protein